jgi:hypothetical protein
MCPNYGSQVWGVWERIFILFLTRVCMCTVLVCIYTYTYIYIYVHTLHVIVCVSLSLSLRACISLGESLHRDFSAIWLY